MEGDLWARTGPTDSEVETASSSSLGENWRIKKCVERSRRPECE